MKKKEKKMKLATRCLPLGSLPYENLDIATRMQAKLFEQMPYLAFYPHMDEEDTILRRTFTGIPGVKLKGKKVTLKTSSNSYKQNLSKLDKAYNAPSEETLEPFAIESPFLDKFLQIAKKFKSNYACISILGPFTVSQMLLNAAEEQVLADKSYRKLFIQSVCVKALWAIHKIRSFSPRTTPIIILEEPLLAQLGTLKREADEITDDLVINLLAKVIEKLQMAGALVAVQCMEKCNWQIPIKAGVDIISFDAYNNPNNLNIFPDDIIEFIKRGGKINWGIVPTMNESLVKGLTVDYMAQRLFATFEGLILAGVSEPYVYNSAFVSVQGNLEHLPVIFAEKAVMIATQLAQRIPVKTLK